MSVFKRINLKQSIFRQDFKTFYATPVKEKSLLLLYLSVSLLQHSFVFQLEASVKAKGKELASKDEEQKKMQEDMEIKLLEQQNKLNKRFLDKQKKMELEMEMETTQEGKRS